MRIEGVGQKPTEKCFSRTCFFPWKAVFFFPWKVRQRRLRQAAAAKSQLEQIRLLLQRLALAWPAATFELVDAERERLLLKTPVLAGNQAQPWSATSLVFSSLFGQKMARHARSCHWRLSVFMFWKVPRTTADYHKPTTQQRRIWAVTCPSPPQFTRDRLPHVAAGVAAPLFAAVLWALRKLILHTLLPRLLPQPTFAVLKYDSGVVGL